MARIKIRVWNDRMGNVYARPVRDDICTRLKNHISDVKFGGRVNGAKHAEELCTAFDQEGTGQLLDIVPQRKRKEVDEGYTVTVLVDAWEFAHWLGYDAHTVFE